MMRRLLLIILCSQLVACAAVDAVNNSFSAIGDFFQGGEDNTEPPHQLVDLNPEIKIKVLWKESIGNGTGEQSLKLVPAYAEGKIFAADHEGVVQAHHAGTGEMLWQNQTEKAISGGVGIGDHTLVFGTSNAEVIALATENGKQLWKTMLSSEILAVPVIAKHIVIIRATDGSLIALNEKNGAKLWNYEHAVPALSIRGAGNPLILNEETLISGDDNGKLIALRLTDGKLLWETSVAQPKGRSEIERLVDLDADPIEVAGTIFLGSYRGGLAAVTVSDGEVLWRNETLSSDEGFSHDWRNLYLTDTEDDVWQVEQRTGSPLWKQKGLHHRKVTAPAVYQNYVIVGDLEGYVHWLSTEDGRELGREQIASSPITAKPLIIDDIVYVYASDGTLTALTAR